MTLVRAFLIAAAPLAFACSDAASPTDAKVADLVGNPAPPIDLNSVGGGKVSTAALSGQVVIVDFWGTYCEPCKKSFPKLQELYSKYKGSGLAVVAVSEDDDVDGIAAFGAQYGAKFPLVWDKAKSVADRWNPKSMPATFIVDRKGIVRFVHRGYHDGEEADIEQQIKSLL